VVRKKLAALPESLWPNKLQTDIAINTYHRLLISRNAKADRNNANRSLKYQKSHCLDSTLLAREEARSIANDPM
jgi:hypothetical protein